MAISAAWIELEKAETRLREKEIDTNERIAMKSMEYQARDIKAQPGEARKILPLYSCIFTFILHRNSPYPFF